MHSDKLGWWAFTRNAALSWAGTIFFSLLALNFAGWLVVALVSTRDVDGRATICGLVFSTAMTARFTINTIWLRRERRATVGTDPGSGTTESAASTMSQWPTSGPVR